MSRHPLSLLVVGALSAMAQTVSSAPTVTQATLDPIVVKPINPTATTIIDQATLEKQPTKNIQVLFDNMPGVNFTDTLNGQPGDIEIRGMGGMGSMMGVGSGRVTMEIDGMDIGQSFVFGHNMSYGRQYFDTADLKAVEVNKGPSSKGFAGNVQFHTKDPVDYIKSDSKFGGEVRTGYSGDSNDYNLGFTLAAQPSPEHGLSVSYTHHWFNELDNKGGVNTDGRERTKRNPLDGDSNSVNAKWVFTPNQIHRFTTTIQHFDVDNDTVLRNQISTESRVSGHTDYATNSQSNRRDAISFAHELEISTPMFDRANWQISAQRTIGKGRNYTVKTLRDNTTASNDNNDFKINTFTLKGGADKSFGTNIIHNLNYGFKLQYSKAHLDSWIVNGSGTRQREYFPNNKQWQTTIHAADRLEFGQSGISLTPSLNLTHVRITPKMDTDIPLVEGSKKYSKTGLGGGLLLDWQPNDNHTFSASYNHATRMPAYGETNGQNYGHWIGKPNPDLKPETSDGLELSWKSQGSLGQLNTTLFYTRYTDMVNISCGNFNTFRPEDGCNVFNEEGNSKTYGIEVDGKLNLDTFGLPEGFTAEGGLAWAKGKTDKQPMTKIDPLNGFIGLRYTHPEDLWGIATRIKFSMAKKVKDLPKNTQGKPLYDPLPGYGVVDITGHYKPVKDLTISGGIYNVLDKKYARWSSARGFRDDFTSKTEAGRYVGVNLRYQF